MTDLTTKIAVLGSTGSIGRSTLDVIAASHGTLSTAAISAHSNLDQAVEQARAMKPQWLVATDPVRASGFDWSGLPRETELVVGEDGLADVVSRDEVDVVVSAIVGSAGLRGTWAGLEAGKRIALANKETLVMAGPLVMQLAERSGGRILPVDSEHSAIHQAIQAGDPSHVHRIILTASGGPFRNHSLEQLSQVTVPEALAHPTWKMGKKITIDSATMMNKALEMIEARWLFDLAPDQIEVVIHPQSVIHSMVEFIDGAVVAQLSPPDMKLPIQYALSYPQRWPGPAEKLDWTRVQHFDLEPPDVERFPALELGREVAGLGGTAGAVLNAANEAAVHEFLNEQLPFHEIVPVCRSVLEHHDFDTSPSLQQLIQLDAWARQEVSRWVCA